MAKTFKKLLCLLLVLTACWAALTLTAAAAEQEPVNQSRASSLSTPTITKMENVTGGIKLTWTKVSGAAQYRVFVKNDSGWIGLLNTTSTSYTYKDAVPGTTYTFTVRCISADEKNYTSGYNSTGWKHTFMLAQPAIKAMENRTTGIKLTWKPVPGAERYCIYVKTAGGDWDYVGNTMGTSFTYIWAESGKSYTFTIRCANKDNNLFTSTFNTKGWQTTYVSRPAIRSLESVDEGIKLSWNAVPGAEGYKLVVMTDEGWKTIGTTAGTSLVWSGAEHGKTYTFSIRCTTADGKSYTSSFNAIGWKHTFIASPDITKLESYANGIRITWKPVTGAEKYRVFVKVDGGWKGIGSSTGTGLTWKDAESGKTYTFTVRCVNKNGEAVSGYNRTGWKHTYIAQPAISNMESVGAGVKLSWKAVPGAAKYRVVIKTADGWKTIANTSDTSFTWTGSEKGKAYIFSIRCTSADGKTYTSAWNSTGWKHAYLATPSISKIETVTGGVRLTWKAVAGAEKYKVVVKTATSEWKLLGYTTGTSFTWPRAASGVNYTFSIRCVSADEMSYTSPFNSTGRQHRPVAQPAISKLQNTSSGIKLSWSAVSGAKNYRIVVKTADGWKTIANTTSTSFVWDGAEKGKTYTFSIRCTDADGKFYTSSFNTTGWSIKRS